MEIKRVVVIILDGVGTGNAPDAEKYGDKGANTLLHVVEESKFRFPNLERMGLLNILYGKNEETVGSYAILEETSPGKDSTTGHWELMGVLLDKPFPVYPNGFPKEVIEEFEKRIGRKVLWNKPASGTEIIKKLGEEHIKTGYPIVYTSADSVFQIAAHEDVIPVKELYRMCKIAREILKGEHAVARVIARPFTGKPGHFWRTPERKDFSLPPPKDTLLDLMLKKNLKVYGIGKVYDLFAHRGFSETVHVDNNTENMAYILKVSIERKDVNLIFTNLVDFDMRYGHRRNLWGFSSALLEFDGFLGNYLPHLTESDVLFITADHGNDPTFKKHTDHTRERVPLFIFGETVKKSNFVGIKKFSDLGATIGEIFGIKTFSGESFLSEIVI